MATQRQIEANRRNALKSTGPKTKAGKARVAVNAWRHGFRAVFTIADDAEQQRFDTLCRLLIQDALPQTKAQRNALIQIAQAVWQMNKLRQWELALYQKHHTDTDPFINPYGEYQAITKKHLPWRLFYRYSKEIETRFFKALEVFLTLKGCMNNRIFPKRVVRRRNPRNQACTHRTKPIAFRAPDRFFRVKEVLMKDLQKARWRNPPPNAYFPEMIQHYQLLFPWSGVITLPSKSQVDQFLTPMKRDLFSMTAHILQRPVFAIHPFRHVFNDQYEARWKEKTTGGFFDPILLPQENTEKFGRFKQALYDHYQPHSLLSYILLDWMAANLWRAFRLDKIAMIHYLTQEFRLTEEQITEFDQNHESPVFPFLLDQGQGTFNRIFSQRHRWTKVHHQCRRFALYLDRVWW